MTNINTILSNNKGDSIFEFIEVSGEDIRKYYLENNYSTENQGTLQNSCMRHDIWWSYFDVYCKEEAISMLIKRNKISGKIRFEANMENRKYYFYG